MAKKEFIGYVVSDWLENCGEILPISMIRIGHQISYPLIFDSEASFISFHSINGKCHVNPIKIKCFFEEVQ